MGDEDDNDLLRVMVREYLKQHGLTPTKDDLGEMREALRDAPKFAALPEDSRLFIGMLEARRMVEMHRDLGSLHDSKKRAQDARKMQVAFTRVGKIIEMLGSDAGSGHLQDVVSEMRQRLGDGAAAQLIQHLAMSNFILATSKFVASRDKSKPRLKTQINTRMHLTETRMVIKVVESEGLEVKNTSNASSPGMQLFICIIRYTSRETLTPEGVKGRLAALKN